MTVWPFTATMSATAATGKKPFTKLAAAILGSDPNLETSPVSSIYKSSPFERETYRNRRAAGVDSVLVWRLDRWGRSLVDLVNTLQEMTSLDVGFVSLSEALDLTTPSGRALAGMLAVFAEFERDILRDRVKVGIDQARKDGKPHGRSMTAVNSGRK